MVDVAIFVDNEQGHLLPTLKMADNLRREGMTVAYIGIKEVLKYLNLPGVEKYIILEDLFPEGARPSVKSGYPSEHLVPIMSGALDGVISQMQPKVILCSYFMCLEGLLIYRRYRIRHVIYHPLLPPIGSDHVKSLSERTSNLCIKIITYLSGDLPERIIDYLTEDGKQVQSLNDIVAPLREMPQLMLCPEVFDLKPKRNGSDIYLGPGIKASGHPMPLEVQVALENKKKIIFASLGSQAREYARKAQAFFSMIIESMQSDDLREFHLILSVGSNLGGWQLKTDVPNVTVFDWIPQTRVLEQTTIAIIHGGLGSVKECIYYGVPMIVIPMGRDQSDNAERVRHHNLGVARDFNRLSKEGLVADIQCVTTSHDIRSAIRQMREKFHSADEQKLEVDLIKNFL